MIATLVTAAGWWLLPLLAAQPRPNPGLGPGEVIRTVVEALADHNSPSPNAGIFTAYQFASPANRSNTGPYGNFIRIVKNPDFATLLTRHQAAYGALTVSADHAEQEVSLRMDNGNTARFRFVVSRQSSQQTQGRCAGCWMVDQVNVVSVEQ